MNEIREPMGPHCGDCNIILEFEKERIWLYDDRYKFQDCFCTLCAAKRGRNSSDPIDSPAKGGAPAMIQRPAPVLTAEEQAAVHPKRKLPEADSGEQALVRMFTTGVISSDELAAIVRIRATNPPPEPPRRQVEQPCCETWDEAQCDGTDGEAYGPLFFRDNKGSIAVMAGSIETPLRFCPWCAAPKLPATA